MARPWAVFRGPFGHAAVVLVQACSHIGREADVVFPLWVLEHVNLIFHGGADGGLGAKRNGSQTFVCEPFKLVAGVGFGLLSY